MKIDPTLKKLVDDGKAKRAARERGESSPQLSAEAQRLLDDGKRLYESGAIKAEPVLTVEARAAVDAAVETARAWNSLTDSERLICELTNTSAESFLAQKRKLTALGMRRN